MEIDETLCVKCAKCITRCPAKAINDSYIIDKDKCSKCGACYDGCPMEAIY